MNDQVTREETVEILRLAEQALPVAGDFVELGCYRGDTSVLLGQLLREYNSLSAISSKGIATVSPVGNPDFTCGKSVEKSAISCGKAVENNHKTCGNLVDKSVHKSVQNSSLETNQTSQPGLKQPKKLWIYDSFAGLPEKTREDASGAGANFQAGELLVTKREVVDKIRKHGLKNVIIKKAWFDDLNDKDLPARIAFAFCDGDLYGSIKTSLRLVYPRLAEQGIIIVHDYNNPELPGSARAVDEFLRARPEFKLQVRRTLAILTKR